MSFLIVIMREAWLCIVSVLIEYVYVIKFLVRYHGLDQDTYWCRYEGIDAGYDTEQDM